MPTIHREAGLRFVTFIDDHPPPHVHVMGDGQAKIAIDAPGSAVLREQGLSKADIRRARFVVERERDTFLKAWDRYHG